MIKKLDIVDELEFVSQGCVDVTPKDELLQKLKKSRETGIPLKIKLGVDPTGSDIHLGHTVALRRLQAFQMMGHQIILVIGDYTGMVGDPTGRSATRKMLTQEELIENSKSYREQVFKILDPEKTQIRYNSEWLKGLSFADLIGLASQVTVAQMLEREDFSERYKAHIPISFVEFFYPLMQGYDSVALEADVEFGGVDQIFNLLMGRHLQKYYGQSPQIAMTVPLLEGTDGVRKMSKSYNNFIGVSESPREIFGKTMSIPDSLIKPYFLLVTPLPNEQIQEIEKRLENGENPRDIKILLAQTLVELFYNPEIGLEAREEFISVFQHREEIPRDTPIFSLKKDIALVELITSEKLATSKSEARRLIIGGGVSLSGEKIQDMGKILSPGVKGVLKVGKRRFLRIE